MNTLIFLAKAGTIPSYCAVYVAFGILFAAMIWCSFSTRNS